MDQPTTPTPDAAQAAATTEAAPAATPARAYAPVNGPAPTVGRIVHFWAPDGVAAPLAAIILRVHSDTSVNLHIFDDGTGRFSARGINSVIKRTVAAEPGSWDWPAKV